MAWPASAGLAVLATVAFAVPRSAWLPHAHGPATAGAWETLLPASQQWLAAWQLAAGAAVSNDVPVWPAILVAVGFGAFTTVVLARTLQRAGLSVKLAALLALVAAAAPLAAWQASSPLGASPAALASSLVLWWVVSRADHERGHAGRRVTVALMGLMAVTEGVARTRGASSLGDTLQLLHNDLDLIGLLLLPSWLGAPAPDVPRRRVWLGLTALALLTSALPALPRAAVLLPWTWWIVGAGVAQLIAWRGAKAVRWAAVGLAAWVALHATQVPWEHQRRQAALVRTWAEGVAARVSDAAPLVVEPSARMLLARALVAARPEGAGHLVRIEDAVDASRTGRRPVLVSSSTQETLRWQGVALDDVDEGVGVPLERVLDALPSGVVTAAVLSQDAAARLSPAQWRALSRIGLRLADAGQPRAHAVVGITGARAEALDTAQVGSTRLDVQPGDPLGRTGVRAPVDLRLEADGTRVSLWLRGQPVLQGAPGLALVFFSTRGDFLAWRSGPDPSRVDGPALGNGPRTRSQVITALPCVDVGAGESRPVGPLAATGALGISVASAGTVDIDLVAPTGATDEARLARGAAAGTSLARQAGTYAVTFAAPSAAVGLLTRGPATEARATATVPARVCAAWPTLHPVRLAGGPVAMRVAPTTDAHFGQGWHDAEIESGTTQFRWMGGPRADLLFTFRAPQPVAFAIDAQGPGTPATGDTIHLLVNGVDVGVRPLLPTRGIYEWTIDAAVLRPGPNTFTLTTTRTRRPADEQPGADARVLGLLVRGWTFTSAP